MKKSQKQVDKELQRDTNWDIVLERLRIDHSSKFPSITKEDIFSALFLLLEYDWNLKWLGDLHDVDLSYEDALKLIENFDFNSIFNTIETSKEIFPGDFLLKYKVKVKVNGLIWVIHNDDKDPLPSDPHAHEFDNNLKLDLSNGDVYKARKLSYRIKKKELLEIRRKAATVFDGELPVLRR